MPVRSLILVLCSVAALGGCANKGPLLTSDGSRLSGLSVPGYIVEAGIAHPVPAGDVGISSSWSEPLVIPAGLHGTKDMSETDDSYRLDTGDQLRIFVYGQPNLSRLYTVDHAGQISVPLIGNIVARGHTTIGLEGVLRSRLGAEFVRDPQVTVDVQQNRPFFILGEVRNAGQFPYVSGMTVETAVAIAGGYSERASTRRFRITRRIDGFVEQIEAPADYAIKPGDTVLVHERFF